MTQATVSGFSSIPTAMPNERAIFLHAIAALPQAMIVVDEASIILFANSYAERLFGYEHGELAGQSLSVLLPPAIRSKHAQWSKDFFKEKHTRAMGAGVDLIGWRKDGSEVAVEIALNPITTARDPMVLASIIDITERKRRQDAKLVHVQKMESLGILAGGIAHDFNNLLTSILGYADLALRELSPVHPAREYIEQVIKGSHSAADLVRQLLAYSGKGKFLMQSLNLAQLIEEMGHLLQVSISKKCVLNYRFEKDLPNIDADCSQIRQVIMNLIINASDAIGERSGVITITTGMMYCDRSYLNGTSADPSKPEGNYVYFEVSDTGCGMNDEVAARIFDPFYTTKTMGRGLGLAAVLGIVRSHGGFIKLYSEVDRGTTFKVLFPASRELQTEAQLSQGNPERAWSTQGTVLLIDDEETVRAVARVMLQRMGFSVITAVDGADGLNKYAAHQQDISLVVMDMTMPHLNGEQTFRELRKINPEVIVILTSGYSEHSAMSQFSGKGLAGFIQKPFRFDDLMTLVRQIHSST